MGTSSPVETGKGSKGDLVFGVGLWYCARMNEEGNFNLKGGTGHRVCRGGDVGGWEHRQSKETDHEFLG